MSTFAEMRTEEEQAIDRVVLDRVLAGIKLLEEKHGPDWADKVDLDTLDLGSVKLCVLGQVYGDYSRGLQELGDVVGSKYGFDSNGVATYKQLRLAWRRMIRTHQEAKNQ